MGKTKNKEDKNMSVISMKQLLEAGVHFGHQTRKWNPKMKKYIFTARNDIHILNLEQTSELIDKAYLFIRDMVAAGKNVLFVGTKKQASEAIKEEAERCGMFYVNTRWLGGCLTNFKTMRTRIDRLNKLNQMEKVGEFELLPKKEVALLKAERDKLESNLGGIKEMREMPGVIFVVDPTKEHICVREAIKMRIPLVGLVDTNCDPSGINFIIPGNDDAIRSVKLIASAVADAVIEAREGVSFKEVDKEEDEKVDLEKVLSESKPTIDMAESISEDEKNKKTKIKKVEARPTTTEAKEQPKEQIKIKSEEVKTAKPKAESVKVEKPKKEEKTEVKNEKPKKEVKVEIIKPKKSENAGISKPKKQEVEVSKPKKEVKVEKVTAEQTKTAKTKKKTSTEEA
jgi:small subunit ribosomal protein S2